jgi:hypothetical protein
MTSISAEYLADTFANGFWVFVGIVAGAFIQYLLGWIQLRAQRRNAIKMLQIEVEMNLSELEKFKERINYLKERILANQISEKDIFVNTQGFDYSVAQPLNLSGLFHSLLGHEKLKMYFDFLRFFNDRNGEIINSMLQLEHARNKSLNYLDFLLERSKVLGEGLQKVADTK